MVRIAAVGDNCIDVYEHGAYPGGNPVNVAVYTRRLGHQSAYIGAVGNDAYGTILLEALSKKEVDTSHVQVLEGNTATTQVTMIGQERILGDYDEGVFSQFTLSTDDKAFIQQFDLMVSGIWSRVENDLSDIHIPIAFDFADKWDSPLWEKVLPEIQFAFYSDDTHPLEQVKAFMIHAQKQGPEMIICTRGEHGSIAYDGQQFYEYGIISCPVVDTMGAGDSYIAGFLCDYFEHHDIHHAMEAGAKNSAVTIAYHGAWT